MVLQQWSFGSPACHTTCSLIPGESQVVCNQGSYSLNTPLLGQSLTPHHLGRIAVTALSCEERRKSNHLQKKVVSTFKSLAICM